MPCTWCLILEKDTIAKKITCEHYGTLSCLLERKGRNKDWWWYSYRPHPHHPYMTSLHGSHGRSRLTTVVTWLFCVLPLTTNSNALNMFSGQRPLYCVMPTGAWLVHVIRYSYLRVSCIYIVHYCIPQVDSVMLVGKVNLPWEPCNDVMYGWWGWGLYEYHHHVVQICILKGYFVFVCFFVCFSFWGTFLHFWLSSIFSVLQKTRLTSRLHFFQLIFKHNFFHSGFSDSPESCFEWRKFRYEVRHLGGGKG